VKKVQQVAHRCFKHRKVELMKWILPVAGFSLLFSPSITIADSLTDQAARICIENDTTPSNYTLTAKETRLYCECEAEIWAKSGTELQLRSTMTYITGDKSHMQGSRYDADDALDFIVAQSGKVSNKCEALFE